MAKSKSFWLGVVFALFLQFLAVYIWNNHVRYMPYGDIILMQRLWKRSCWKIIRLARLWRIL